MNILKGRVRNYSNKTLWVVETDTGPAIAHKLAPQRQSPASADADGVRAVDGTPISGHNSWWKLRNVNTADITNSGARLEISCLACSSVLDTEYGSVQLDDSNGWGEPLI